MGEGQRRPDRLTVPPSGSTGRPAIAPSGAQLLPRDRSHAEEVKIVRRVGLGFAATPGPDVEDGHVDLFEYQARDLFAAHGVPVLDAVVATTPEEARAGAEELGAGTVVVKAQVKTGGRGKAGGVKLAHSPEEAGARAVRDPRYGHQGPHGPPRHGRPGREDRRGVLLLGAARPGQPHLSRHGVQGGRHGDRAARGRAAGRARPGPGRRDPGHRRREGGRDRRRGGTSRTT